MYVAELDRPWLDSPFLFQGFYIESPDQLEALRECCEYVLVEAPGEREADRGSGGAGDLTIPGVAETSERRAFRQTVRRLLEYRQRLYPQLKQVLEDARLGHIMDSRDTRILVQQLVELVSVNPQAALWLTNLKDRHSHTADHCFNTMILSVAFGTHLKIPKENSVWTIQHCLPSPLPSPLWKAL